jgi:hypothetical protein
MPTSSRKSSVGGASRRGPLKAHIPYRGDNPEVGKKTGIAVQHVARQSDGFEPFEQILQQADGRTPPRPKGRKKSLNAAAHQDENDYGSDNGWEESMQMDSMYCSSSFSFFLTIHELLQVLYRIIWLLPDQLFRPRNQIGRPFVLWLEHRTSTLTRSLPHVLTLHLRNVQRMV